MVKEPGGLLKADFLTERVFKPVMMLRKSFSIFAEESPAIRTCQFSTTAR
jgi:hypothetical protein